MFGLKTKTAPAHAGLAAPWLARLNTLYVHHDTLDCLLRLAAELAVELLRAEQCVITWVCEDKSAMQVRAHYDPRRHNGSLLKIRQTIPLPAGLRECPRLEFESGEIVAAVFSAPLHINRQVVGFLYIVRPPQSAAEFETELFSPLSAQIGFAIEAQQSRYMLSSRYASAVGRDDPGRSVLRAVQNPEMVAKMIAKSFYKDLRKAGFSTNQILTVASEIIGNLNEALQKTKARTEETK